MIYIFFNLLYPAGAQIENLCPVVKPVFLKKEHNPKSRHLLKQSKPVPHKPKLSLNRFLPCNVKNMRSPLI